MQIKELILNNFGKFSDRSFLLSPGINIVYGENEFGKSTIHSFIKLMLFGVVLGKKTEIKEEALEKYKPWDRTGEYAGAMRFECESNTYTLKRSFEHQGKLPELVCEETGKNLNVAQGDLDALLGKIDGVNYENTVSISQRKAETTDELSVELKNYAANYQSRGSNDIQIEEVQQYLQIKKQEIENNIHEDKLRVVSQKEKLNLEHDYIKRELDRLQEVLKGNQKLEAMQRSKQEKRNTSLNIPVLPCLCVLVLTVPVTVIVHRPWNVLTVIVMILALGLYIWNKLKHKPIGRQVKKELSKEIDKLSWENQRLISEILEKEIVLDNIAEQLRSVTKAEQKEHSDADKIAGIELAMKRVETVSQDIQKDFGLLLNESATEILKAITMGRYRKLEVSETLEVCVYKDNQKLTLEQISRGAVEQVYFALRMAITTLLHNEELPILLDDTFAYYDDSRLVEVLKWLDKNKKQVIIFTCHKREEEILKEQGILYNIVK